MAAPFTVIVGGEDVSREVDAFSFSNSDPGGHEISNLPLANLRAYLGAKVKITAGLTTVFEGRVSEPDEKILVGEAGVGVEGAGGALKDGLMQELYIDRDMTKFGEPAAGRIQPLTPAGFRGFGGNILSAGDRAQLETEIVGSWAVKPHCCPVLITPWPFKKIYYVQYTTSSVLVGDANWIWNFNIWELPDYLGTLQNGPNLKGTAAAGWQVVTVPSRTLECLHYYNAAPAGAVGEKYAVYWQMVLFGDHRLPIRGAEPNYGFYASDIARDIVARVPALAAGRIELADGYVIPQLTFYQPVTHEAALIDVARLVGWHWGVWETPLLGGLPQLDFHPYPTGPTCSVTRADCEDLDVSQRLAGQYDEISVTYGNQSGTGDQTVERTRANPVLDRAGLSRQLDISMGESSEAAAEVFGDYVLALSQRNGSATGSVTLRGNVETPAGAKPAYLLKSGKDRLRITDLARGFAYNELSDFADFAVKRVEVSVSPSGVSTRVELGIGADLIEVLQARLAVSAAGAGVG